MHETREYRVHRVSSFCSTVYNEDVSPGILGMHETREYRVHLMSNFCSTVYNEDVSPGILGMQ